MGKVWEKSPSEIETYPLQWRILVNSLAILSKNNNPEFDEDLTLCVTELNKRTEMKEVIFG